MNRCVCCGEVIPEGRMVCSVCECAHGGQKMANEKRLIDYRKATEIVLNELKGKITATTAVMLVSKMKYATVDAVEVVRCKDCKHYKPQNKSARWTSKAPYCMRSATIKVSPDDFCSRGERKDNERIRFLGTSKNCR